MIKISDEFDDDDGEYGVDYEPNDVDPENDPEVLNNNDQDYDSDNKSDDPFDEIVPDNDPDNKPDDPFDEIIPYSDPDNKLDDSFDEFVKNFKIVN